MNHPELLHKHPALLVSPVTRYIEKVRYSRTTPTSSVRGGSTVPNLLYLQQCRGNTVCRVLMH